MPRDIRGLFCVALAACVLHLVLWAPVARAALITTEQALGADPGARARVTAFLAREDVARELRSLGVDPGEAAARVAALTDAEAETLAARIDALPAAGASAAGALIVIGVVLLVLIFLDYFGVTDIFTWVNKARR
jgi:hypothetical protein